MPRSDSSVRAAGCAALCFISGMASATAPLALSCQGCHETSVNSPEMPALDRMPATRIAASLRASRDAPRSGSIMARFALRLSDAQIDALARELGQGNR